MKELEKLKRFLEENRKDLLEMKDKETLTDEGKGMLGFINSIYEYMNWK
jgi:hypothetical protein|tara:strand:- start:595 stop:741 length:147 start_codon:yes stop_codon:yes gene_type:complete